MAKVQDYKVTDVRYGSIEHGLTKCNDTLINVLNARVKGKINGGVYAVITLKRRQTIETWINQITKYLLANCNKLGVTCTDSDELTDKLNILFEVHNGSCKDEIYLRII